MTPKNSIERVKVVIDGDTFTTFHHEDPVRLEGVDAPEIGTPNSQLAKAMLELLIEERKVFIVTVAYDDFGRRIARVYVGPQSVNETMVDLLQKQEAAAPWNRW